MTRRITLLIISFLLFVIPFFWFPQGRLDLGGDSTRLYFLDPLNYLISNNLFFISNIGIGYSEPSFFSIPFITLIYIFHQIFDPYITIVLFNSAKLVIGFLSVFAVIQELLPKAKKDHEDIFLGAIVAGLFYIFIPTMTGNWDKAILSHTQFFINPLMFYLILKYINTKREKFVWFALMLSFIFSINFGYTSAPSFFAFFPLAFLYLLIYSKLVGKSIPLKKMLIFGLLFFGIHAFHLIPQFLSLFDQGSYTNTRVFDKESIFHEGVRYLTAILPLAKVSNYLLTSYGLKDQLITSCIPIVLVLVALALKNSIRKLFITTSIFFFITLYLLSANITNFGVEIYKLFFHIPGFSMFRNFIGQWLYVYSFFYSILLGLSIFVVIGRLKSYWKKLIIALIIVIVILNGWNFIAGKKTNTIIFQKTRTHIGQIIDPNSTSTLESIRNINSSSKFMNLPVTDSFYQVVPGKDNEGVYIGPSQVANLTGKNDFAGYQSFGPFSELFLKIVRDNDRIGLKNLLGILNIEYIVYNNSPFVLDSNNEDFLYGHVRKSLPKSQIEYREFVKKISSELLYKKGSYEVLKIDRSIVIPHVYLSSNIIPYKLNIDSSISVNTKAKPVYIEKSLCEIKLKKCKLIEDKDSNIFFRKINPTKYEVTIQNLSTPSLLVLSDGFSDSWKAFRVKKSLTEERNHLLVNGYANGWLINPDNSQKINIILELTNQQYFYYGSFITFIALLVMLIWGIKISKKKVI